MSGFSANQNVHGPILVADVGGTTSRLALVTNNDQLLAPISTRYSNKDFGSFYEIVTNFLALQETDEITACCVAMAGPVFAGRGQLTNRDWEISTEGLKLATSASQAMVMNDLKALGYTVGQLRPQDLTPILSRNSANGRNGQSLVIGIGTGFNVCPVKTSQQGPTVCFETESGHTSLSAKVMKLLQAEIGTHAEIFETAEDLFSGKGLLRLHQLRTNNENLRSADEIVRQHTLGADDSASQSLDLFAKVLGAHCQELMLQYLPLDGIYFAGSVARGVLGSSLAGKFCSALDQHHQFKNLLCQIPVSVINKDAAALVGCAVAGRSAWALQP